MGELEKLKKELKKYCSDNGVILYEVDDDNLTAENSIGFTSGDYKEFLKIAEKQGIKLIYYEETFGETKQNEIGEIYIGFAYNGILHTSSIIASWYEEELEETDEEDKEESVYSKDSVNMEIRANTKSGLIYIKEKSEETIKIDFMEFGKKDYPDAYTGEALVIHIFKLFLESKGIYNEYNLSTKLQMKIDKVKDTVESEITQVRFEKEKSIMPGLINECATWIMELGLKRANQSNIYAFLNEKRIKLTNLSFDILYTQANNKLKH